MRASAARLLAAVKSSSKYLEPNTPTGLTGLTTHPAPRPALIYTYRQTLHKLAQLPQTAVYRQSTEALTKQRLKIVEATKPPGYEEWFQRVQKQIAASPGAYGRLRNSDGSLGQAKLYEEKTVSWDGEYVRGQSWNEGPQTAVQAENKGRAARDEAERVDKEATEGKQPAIDDLEVEPPLTADQISEIEQKIGAGLIEEVLQVAEGELELVAEMLRSRAWEPLEEQAPPNQWKYFERGNVV